MREIITDYTELHTGDVICYNGNKHIIIGKFHNVDDSYQVNCICNTKENKIHNTSIRWNTCTSVERLGHINLSKLIDNVLKEYEEEAKKEI